MSQPPEPAAFGSADRFADRFADMDEIASKAVLPGRLERLLSELRDEQVPALDGAPDPLAALVELSYALRPSVHEGRVPTYGAIVPGRSLLVEHLEVADASATLIPVLDLDIKFARRFADGTATFAIRNHDGIAHLACFDRSIASEHDLVGLQILTDGVVIQRHGSGQVRVYGPAGVVRWDGISWHHDPPLDASIRRLGAVAPKLPVESIRPVLKFAVHELGGRRIGSTLIWRPTEREAPANRIERLVHNVPQLKLDRPGQAAAIAHALSQTDGAAVFDGGAVLQAIGIRLAPSTAAERDIAALGGMRHTSAVRYSHDDPDCVVIVVSDAGPVTIMHGGRAIATVDPSDDLIG